MQTSERMNYLKIAPFVISLVFILSMPATLDVFLVRAANAP